MSKKAGNGSKTGNGSRKAVWTYAYQIVPPQSEDRLQAIKTLLDREQTAARLGQRTWEARVVLEEKVTHVMVVADSPEQNRDVNRSLEAELKRLQVGYSLTAALAVNDEDGPSKS